MTKSLGQPPEADWRHRAECRGLDTNLFFPISSTATYLADITEARTVCSVCPVQGECLRLATDLAIDDGIWGGLTASERRTARRRPAKARLSHYR